MKPFLFLGTRPEDTAADEEYSALLRFGGLQPDQLLRVRLEAAPMPAVDLARFSGIILGGSPFTYSDAPAQKSATQRRVEAELTGLLDTVVDADFPFLGACYGVSTLGVHQGGAMDRQFGEPVGDVEIFLADGADDPLLAGMPPRFRAFVGHKEGCSRLPSGAELLACSAECPVQMFRIKQNLYATQFHPELDATGLVARIIIYRHAGYFPPQQADQVIAAVRAANVTVPHLILRNFVTRYGTG
ncbi:glutamine amidotransferase [Arthrobacter sp. I2-34]|uniref:Glutamine amidotransferase n=1 Tax=Arthrobacter hankyongi TaxID=2904801 RepID=A0ABS9L6X4_9MICC|nr:glutamine amidotransferase [Arthrobacter hankyongi]MCG2622333.1 glutamine amidotransferase [Arthrobacter hankyongi]